MKTKFSGLLTLLLALVVQISFAQQKQVSGTVVDNGGLPLPGVNVTVVGTDTGTQTDMDGKYSLTVQQGQTLKFTFVGFRTVTKVVGAENVINVTLEEGTVLETVTVSTGYKTTTKRKSATAVTTVTAEEIQDRPQSSALMALQGKVAGLNIGTNTGQPGTSGTIIIRGLGSINGKTNPLYIIDGVAVPEGNFVNLNPNDVASATVLKGPSATAIYGNRGANGVIVITTKSGKYDQKMQINYQSQYGFAKLMPLNIELMNTKERLTYLRDFNISGAISANMTDEQIAEIAKTNNTYWLDYFYRTAAYNRQNLSISSGSKNIKTYTAINYLSQEGTIKDSKLQRFGFRNKLNMKSANDKFHMSTNVAISYSKSDYLNGAGSSSVYFNPFMQGMEGLPNKTPYNPDGSVTTDGGLTSSTFGPLDGPYVLLNSLRYNRRIEDQLHLLGRLHADWNFWNHFTAAASFSVNYTSFKEHSLTDPRSLLGPYQVDFNAQYGGIESDSWNRRARFTTQTNLEYANTFGKHSIDINLYTEYHKNHYNGLGFSTRGLDPKLIGSDAAFQLHTREQLPGAAAPALIYNADTDLDLTNITSGMFSYFATADYDYDGRLGFTGTIRRDASFRFTDDNQWGTFWSVAGRWNIDQEKFMDNTAFNLLKLYADYGVAGNQFITGGFFGGIDLFKNTYAAGTGYQGAPAYYPGNLANTELEWEKSKSFEIGLDFALWKNKLQGNLAVYRKETDNLFQSKYISPIFGRTSVNANIGSMKNEGVEVSLRYNIFRNQDWLVQLSGNASYNHNEFIKLAGADENGFLDRGMFSYQEGKSLGQFYTVDFVGVNPSNGHSLYRDKNGNLTENLREADRRFTNQFAIPEIQGGFGAYIKYKGFSLTQNWVFFAHYNINNFDLSDLTNLANITGFGNGAARLLDGWRKPGDITETPDIHGPDDVNRQGNVSDRFLQDASYLRLRSIIFGYTLNKDQLKNTPFSSIKIYVEGENLLTFTNYENFDPESGYGGNTRSRYPSSKVYTVGLNISF